MFESILSGFMEILNTKHFWSGGNSDRVLPCYHVSSDFLLRVRGHGSFKVKTVVYLLLHILNTLDSMPLLQARKDINMPTRPPSDCSGINHTGYTLPKKEKLSLFTASWGPSVSCQNLKLQISTS